jgi:hypothetical protein
MPGWDTTRLHSAGNCLVMMGMALEGDPYFPRSPCSVAPHTFLGLATTAVKEGVFLTVSVPVIGDVLLTAGLNPIFLRNLAYCTASKCIIEVVL